MQLYFRAPDDTLQPPDSNTEADVPLRYNIDVSGVSSNWATFVVSLKDGFLRLTNQFQHAHLSVINLIDFQFQIQNPHNTTLWGLDANNQIIIDNFKLERLFTATPPAQRSDHR